eukprot:scaffold7074_cov256-Pinguiococcus_pyrenoidosus.AAC.2
MVGCAQWPSSRYTLAFGGLSGQKTAATKWSDWKFPAILRVNAADWLCDRAVEALAAPLPHSRPKCRQRTETQTSCGVVCWESNITNRSILARGAPQIQMQPQRRGHGNVRVRPESLVQLCRSSHRIRNVCIIAHVDHGKVRRSNSRVNAQNCAISSPEGELVTLYRPVWLMPSSPATASSASASRAACASWIPRKMSKKGE